MGILTYGEFQDYVSLQFGKNTAWTSPTNYIGIWVNTAYRRLTTQDMFWAAQRRFYFPELETSTSSDTADGTPYVATPSNCLVVRDVYDTTNNVHLHNIPYRKYISYTDRSDTTAESAPTEWVRFGSYIHLHPTPDATYALSIYYRQIPTALSESTDKTVIGAEWDEPIITLASYIGKVWTMDYEKAKLLKGEFQEQVAGIVSLYGEEEKSRQEYLRIDEQYKNGGY